MGKCQEFRPVNRNRRHRSFASSRFFPFSPAVRFLFTGKNSFLAPCATLQTEDRTLSFSCVRCHKTREKKASVSSAEKDLPFPFLGSQERERKKEGENEIEDKRNPSKSYLWNFGEWNCF